MHIGPYGQEGNFAESIAILRLKAIEGALQSYKPDKNISQEKQLTLLFKTTEEELSKLLSYNTNLITTEELQERISLILKASDDLLDKYASKNAPLEKNVRAAHLHFQKLLSNINSLSTSFANFKSQEESMPLPSSIHNNLYSTLLDLSKLDKNLASKLIKNFEGPQTEELKAIWKKVKQKKYESELDSIYSSIKLSAGLPGHDQANALTLVSSQIKAAFLHFKLDSGENRNKMIVFAEGLRALLIDYPVEDQSLLNISDLKEELLVIIYMLRTYSSIPSTIESFDIKNEMEISSFFQAARTCIEKDHIFAYQFLRKLAKDNKNEFLTQVSASPKAIDLGNTPIDANLLAIVSTLHSQLESIQFGPLIGSAIHLENCTHTIASLILSQLSPNVKEVFLSSYFLSSTPCEQLVTKANVLELFKGVLKLNILPPEGRALPLHITCKELINILTLFPKVKDLKIPALQWTDDPLPFHSINMCDFGEYSKAYDFFYKLYDKCDTRVQHAFIRAFAKGTLEINNAESALSWLSKDRRMVLSEDNRPLFHRVLFVWILNQRGGVILNNKTSFPKFQEILSEYDGPELCHLLLSSGLLAKLTTLPMLGLINFSDNPLLTDEELTAFIQSKGASETSNSEKIHFLRLTQCEELTDKGVQTLLKNCKNLEFLDLRGCTQLSDLLFINLPLNCLAKLKQIDLRKTNISHAQVKLLRQQYPQLDIVWDETMNNALSLEALRSDQGDLILVGKEGGEEKIHKDLLNLLSSQTAKDTSLKLSVPLSKESLKALIKFVYTGSLRGINQDIAVELIHFSQSSKYPLELLNQRCQLWLNFTLTRENVMERLKIAKSNHLLEHENYGKLYLDLSCHPDNSGIRQYRNKFELEEISSFLFSESPFDSTVEIKSSEGIFVKAKASEGLDMNIQVETDLENSPLLNIPVNKSLLSLRSSFFLKKFQKVKSGGKVKIKSNYSKGTEKIIYALMNDKPLNFFGMNIKDVVTTLKEVDKMDLTASIIEEENLVTWLQGQMTSKEIDFIDPDWSRLLEWAFEHNCAKIGCRFVLLTDFEYRDKGNVRKDVAQDPLKKRGLNHILQNPALEYFRQMLLAKDQSGPGNAYKYLLCTPSHSLQPYINR